MSAPTTPSPPAPYEGAIDGAAQRGLEVWIEVDLAKRWMQGSASFNVGLRRVALLASRPGVVGIKIADELGYRDAYRDRPACVLAFLHDASIGLRAAAPHHLLLADFIVPELGCAPGLRVGGGQNVTCQRDAQGNFPALTLPTMDRVAASGYLDAIDLSTGLLDAGTYQSWGIDQLKAQQAAWREITSRAWGKHLMLNARKALAHPGTYEVDGLNTASNLKVFVDAPTESGAHAVDVWTWRQQYQGGIYRLMNPGNAPNALWSALRARSDRGSVLMTHFSPSSVEVGVGPDLDVIAHVFRGVFVAAGVG